MEAPMSIVYYQSILIWSLISEARKNPRIFPTSPFADHIPNIVPSV